MNQRLQAAKTAFKRPESVTVQIPVETMDDSSLFKPRDYVAEYAELGYDINIDLIPEAFQKRFGKEMNPAEIGFVLHEGLYALSVYEIGRNGNPIEAAIPWIKKREL